MSKVVRDTKTNSKEPIWKNPRAVTGGVVVLIAMAALGYFLSNSPYRGVPKRAIASIKAGDAAMEKDSVEMALRHYFDAVDLDPTLSEVTAKIAEAYFIAGLQHKTKSKLEMMDAMMTQSRQYLDQAFRIRPDAPYAFYVKGLHAQEGNEIDSAIVYMQLAETAGLHILNLHLSLAYLYNDKEETGKCMDQFLKAYALRKQDPSILYNLGELYFRTGNYSKAVSFYGELVSVQPDDSRNTTHYAAALWKNGDERKAREIFNDIITKGTERDITRYNLVAWVLIDKEIDLEWGLKLAQTAEAIKPGNIESLDILGWGYYQNGDYENAVKYLNRAMIRKPSDEIKIQLEMAKDKLEESRSRKP